MRNVRHIGITSLVAVTVVGLVASAVLLGRARQDERAPVASVAQERAVAPAAARKPALALTASARTVDAGARVTLRIRTDTKHARTVRLQRWDAGRKAWRHVAKRSVRRTAVVRVTPPTGTTRYRAVAPRVRHRTGGKLHTHRAARSTTVAVTARARIAAHRPATLSADERTLLTAVTTARRTYARPTVTAATDEGADACLTTYARAHSQWMATQGRALDPGSPEHRAAERQLPDAACPGRSVWSLTRAVGTPGALSDVVAGSVDAWLASPYGETGRLLTACHDAPAFEYGVAATVQSGTRWLTVLVAAPKSATVSSGAC